MKRRRRGNGVFRRRRLCIILDVIFNDDSFYIVHSVQMLLHVLLEGFELGDVVAQIAIDPGGVLAMVGDGIDEDIHGDVEIDVCKVQALEVDVHEGGLEPVLGQHQQRPNRQRGPWLLGGYLEFELVEMF